MGLSCEFRRVGIAHESNLGGATTSAHLYSITITDRFGMIRPPQTARASVMRFDRLILIFDRLILIFDRNNIYRSFSCSAWSCLSRSIVSPVASAIVSSGIFFRSRFSAIDCF
jgi:hypothetical protein